MLVIFLRPLVSSARKLVQDITVLGAITLKYTTDSAKLMAQKLGGNFLKWLRYIYICDNCLCCVHQRLWNTNTFEILMSLLLYTCSFCYFSYSGDPHRIVPEMNTHSASDELGNRPYYLIVQADWPLCVLGDKSRICCRHHRVVQFSPTHGCNWDLSTNNCYSIKICLRLQK